MSFGMIVQQLAGGFTKTLLDVYKRQILSRAMMTAAQIQPKQQVILKTLT